MILPWSKEAWRVPVDAQLISTTRNLPRRYAPRAIALFAARQLPSLSLKAFCGDDWHACRAKYAYGDWSTSRRQSSPVSSGTTDAPCEFAGERQHHHWARLYA